MRTENNRFGSASIRFKVNRVEKSEYFFFSLRMKKKRKSFFALFFCFLHSFFFQFVKKWNEKNRFFFSLPFSPDKAANSFFSCNVLLLPKQQKTCFEKKILTSTHSCCDLHFNSGENFSTVYCRSWKHSLLSGLKKRSYLLDVFSLWGKIVISNGRDQ